MKLFKQILRGIAQGLWNLIITPIGTIVGGLAAILMGLYCDIRFKECYMVREFLKTFYDSIIEGAKESWHWVRFGKEVL